MAPDATAEEDSVRLSEQLFKAKWRIAVATAVARRATTGATFTNKELADELGDPPGKAQVGAELTKLRAAGLIRSAEVGGTDRTKPLVAVPCQYWAAVLELYARAGEFLADADG